MILLKQAALGKDYLGVIDYLSGDDIVLSVDSSQTAAGFVLYQERTSPKAKVIILFDSIGMTDVEQRYSQPKLELCGVYKAVRKLRYHLLGTRFVLEIDAMSLRHMINSPDVGNAAMIRWIAYLKQFDFTIRHIPGKEHLIPDGLSRAHFHIAEEADDGLEQPHIQATTTHNVSTHIVKEAPTPTPIPFQQDKYKGRFRQLGLWLSTGGTHTELSSLPRHDRKWLRKNIGKFFLDQERLFRRNQGLIPLLVLDDEDEKHRAQVSAHEECGHRGRDAMTSLLLQRVWWESIRGDCLKHARSCTVCQIRSRDKEVEANRSAPIPRLFETFALDIVDLGSGTGTRRYLVLARDLLTGWIEGRALPNKLSSSVAKFIEDDILANYGPVVRQILTDNGPENSGATAALLARLGLRHALITPNHPQGNSIVERGHAPVVDGLLKAAYDDRERTFLYLSQILWADRITARRSTGQSPFELVYGYIPALPIDHEFITFQLFDWSLVDSTSALLAFRARQLRRRDADIVQATALLQYARSLGRQYADSANAHKLRGPLAPATMVLLNSTATFLGKSEDRWSGPFLVHSQLPSGSYMLTELDGTLIQRSFGSNRLRQYFPRSRVIAEPRSYLDDAVDGAFDGPLVPFQDLPSAFNNEILTTTTDTELVQLTNDLPATVPSQDLGPQDLHFNELPFHQD
ncbi:hypothetical protein A4X13_0g8819 [Tilletia indica]|uniref:Integrase catalytic domain-containing protein n=1 Tax=Tilletia indica TaxID=43049 RepID=A0A177T4W3_9BASI|nr:hypothetical protein A4X13_0g8819 [Tilletia indica]